MLSRHMLTVELTPQVQALRTALSEVRRAGLKPTPKLTLPQWADEYRMLPAESAATPGRWRTSRVAVARGPMEAITDAGTNTVSAMCCTQLLKTELILNTIGYYIHQDPAPMIVMQPTVELAEAFSKDRISPMVRDTPVLNGKIADAKKQFEAAIAANPTHSESHYQLAMALVNEGKLPEAAKEFNEYLKLSPDGPNSATAKALVAQLPK